MCSSSVAQDLSGQVAVVIGGTRGIGWAICEGLHRRGARVVTCGATDESVAHARSKAANIPERLHVSRADVRNEADLRALIDQATNAGGQFTTLIVCAGRAWRGDAMETSPAEWDECMELNLKAPYLAARAALPQLKHVANANIVFVSSIWAITATRRRLAYSVAKAGLAALTRNLAVDHGPDGVRINAVAPGYIDTELLQRSLREVSAGQDLMPQILARHPLKRIGTAGDVAETVAFLAGPGATFITGQLIVVDGGVTSQFSLADLWEG